jgi:AcrR family transcriptional regulator
VPELTRPTQRQEQKEATRQRVIEAAKTMFRQQGYEAVTIRDIAQVAGVSAGTVVGAFGGKVDLFNEVIIAIFAATAEIARAADPGPENHSTIDRLVLRTEAVYEDQLKQLELVRDGMMIAWLRSKEADRRNRAAAEEILADLASILHDGIERGELAADFSIPTAIEIIFTLYQNNYRRAVFSGWNAKRLGGLFRQQLELLFSGLAIKELSPAR